MNYKTKLITGSVVSALVAGFVWYTSYFTTLGTTLFYFAVSLALIFLVLIFVSKKIFDSWRMFSTIYFFVSIIIISIPMQPTGNMGPTSFIDREAVGTFLAVLFLVISLIIIIYKSIQLKKKTI